MIVFWMVVGLVFLGWAIAVIRLGVWHEWHHEYLGVAIVLLPWWPAHVVGFLVMLDDAFQHLAQLEHPTYLSPLHRLWDWIARRF